MGPMLSSMNKAMNELRSLVMCADSTWTETGIPRISMIKAEACANLVYQPMLHLVLQGAKLLSFGGEIIEYKTGTYFIVPVDMPATGEIFSDGPEQPFLAVSLALDANIIASLTVGNRQICGQGKGGDFTAIGAPDEMIDAWLRMMKLTSRPNESAVLAPLIEREILFRVMQGPLGHILYDIACPNGRMAQIRRAIYWIRDRYTQPLLVEDLANIAGMSVAGFYRHFKSITNMTPIQYQKRLRLIRARWLLIFEPRSAATIAFSVGYESASQFSREYTRFYGIPPARDAAQFKSTVNNLLP